MPYLRAIAGRFPARGLCLLLVCALALLSGCPGSLPRKKAAPPTPPPTLPVTTQPSGGGENLVMLVLVNVLSFEVPRGAASESENLWSYLNEEAVPAQQGIGLVRNGFRAGVGKETDWPDVADALKEMAARRLRESSITAVPGNPAEMILKPNLPAQPLFLFHDDRTLTGEDFPAGDGLLTFVCTLNESDRTVVHFSFVPQVQARRRQPSVYKGDSRLMLVEKAVIQSLDSLAFRVTVPSKDFLVIGPSSDARRGTSAGKAFLTNQREGMEFETVHVLTPRVVAVPVGKGL